MPFSISPSATFATINWDNFEDRPRINEPMTFCKEDNWNKDVKCCMDEYSIEHVLNRVRAGTAGQTPEIAFLEQYPCINGPELEELAFKGQEPAIPPSPKTLDQPCDTGTIKAFLDTAKKFGFGNFADVFRLGKEPTLSCSTIMRMAFRYGALALEMGRDPRGRLSSKTFE